MKIVLLLFAEWCPTQDKFLDVKYDEESVAEGKAFAKETLQVNDHSTYGSTTLVAACHCGCADCNSADLG